MTTLRRRCWRTLGLCLAVVTSGCAGPSQPTTIASFVQSTRPPAESSSPSAAGSHQPGVVGRDWAKAASVEPPPGDPTATTPPYVNPGSLGHPQHYQGGQADLLDVATAGAPLVAVGYTARDFRAAAWFSDDGLAWTLIRGFPADESSVATAVASGPAGVVAVGGTGPDAAVWTSLDGRTWRRLSVAAFHDETQIRMTSVVAWGHGFVAGGYVGSLVGPIRAAFWTSPDGGAWTRAPDDATFADARVSGITAARDGSRLVAVGAAGDARAASGAAAWQSRDGMSWQRAGENPDLNGAVMNSVTAGENAFVAVGSDLRSVRAVTWRSADGLTWTQAPDDPDLDNFGLKIEMRDVSWTGSGYLAGGHFLFGTQFPSAAIWTSQDGVTWSRAPDAIAFSQGKIQGVSSGGPGLVAVGSFGSPDFSIPTAWVSPPS
jgi:hypothetical protein